MDLDVPTLQEYSTLIDYLGGEKIAEGKLKENGTIHWSSPNTGATNESSFSALPGGYRSADPANFDFIQTRCYLWTQSTDFSMDPSISRNAFCKILLYNSDELNVNSLYDKRFGFSVRCIKEMGFRVKPMS